MSENNPVVCLCWNCGKEIHADEKQNFVDEEIWCNECAGNGEN